MDTPWRRFLAGDGNAISEDAKDGALLFFRQANQGGAQCVQCHTGPSRSNERARSVGLPQNGHGMGDGVGGTEDFGRGRETGNVNDRHQCRSAPLLAIEIGRAQV